MIDVDATKRNFEHNKIHLKHKMCYSNFNQSNLDLQHYGSGINLINKGLSDIPN